MPSPDVDHTPLLLHACCGPCALMPTQLLREAGFAPTILYCNPNIAPREEYDRRLQTLLSWAEGERIEVEEVALDPRRWEEAVAEPYREALAAGDDPDEARRERCRGCYRLRFEAAAEYAKSHDFSWLSTTLSVSPYQYVDVIAEELTRAAQAAGVQARFEDFRSSYPEATRRAKALGLYRQNYCGCGFSAKEARQERERRKALRAQEAARRREITAPARAAAERAQRKRAEQRRAYESKKARQREVLRSLRGLS